MNVPVNWSVVFKALAWPGPASMPWSANWRTVDASGKTTGVFNDKGFHDYTSSDQVVVAASSTENIVVDSLTIKLPSGILIMCCILQNGATLHSVEWTQVARTEWLYMRNKGFYYMRY